MAGYKGSKINPSRFQKDQIKIILVLLPLAIFMGIPIVFIVCHAFKPMDELFAFPPQILVHRPTLQNFSKLFKASQQSEIPMSRYVFNTLIVTLSVVLLSILMSTMAGYALSKLRFRGKKTIMEINNAALMFVSVAVMIPRYLVIDTLGLKNTYLAHILPLIAMPVGLFLVKQFIDQVPDALIDAAYMDGAGDFKIYRSIILPLIKPAIATTVILAFQQVWVNVESSNLYVEDKSMQTLAFYLNTLANTNNNVAGQGVQAAGVLIQFLPNLAIFLILRKSFMNTMVHSGIK